MLKFAILTLSQIRFYEIILFMLRKGRSFSIIEFVLSDNFNFNFNYDMFSIYRFAENLHA